MTRGSKGGKTETAAVACFDRIHSRIELAKAKKILAARNRAEKKSAGEAGTPMAETKALALPLEMFSENTASSKVVKWCDKRC